MISCKITGKTIETKLTTLGNPKLPKGWKWKGDDSYSPEAWNKLYFLRAITIPVVSPVIEDANPQAMRAAWDQLNAQLKEAWSKSTEAANWAVKRLWSNDVLRQPGQLKCPPPPKLYLYGERDWTGWSQSAGAVLRTIEASYKKKRYEIVWTGSAGVPNVRYPYPFPIHNASWHLTQEKGGQIVFDCRLPSGRVAMRLRTKDKGGKYRMEALKHLIDNPDLRGEAALLKKSDGTIMVKIVGWFPKVVRPMSGELWVRTSASVLLTIFNERDEQQMVIHGDWIRRKVAGHSAGLERWHDDQKLERRVPKRRRRKSLEDMRAQTDKMHNRLKTFVDQTASQVVNFAVRQKLAVLRYDDREQGYFLSFRWDELKQRIETLCGVHNIKFERFIDAAKAVTARKIGKPKEAIS